MIEFFIYILKTIKIPAIFSIFVVKSWFYFWLVIGILEPDPWQFTLNFLLCPRYLPDYQQLLIFFG